MSKIQKSPRCLWGTIRLLGCPISSNRGQKGGLGRGGATDGEGGKGTLGSSCGNTHTWDSTLKRSKFWANKAAQQIKETTTKSNALRLVPTTHVVEREDRLPQVEL